MMRFVGVLAGVCIIAAIVLSGLYNITKPLIAEQNAKQIRQALENVVPKADNYEKLSYSKGEYYRCFHEQTVIGYALSVTAPGYSGDIKMLVGLDTQGMILGVEVLSQAETPGLGAKCTEVKYGDKRPWFLRQFNGREAAELRLKDIETITGATITSEAILDGVKKSAEIFLKEKT
jgi:Na+-translocating ferredoxin:NAD+ oxidoreductase subunit G